mmetsp:Transcript_50739/g.158525  ORF Transcript_50739/g.158525 Transcript_50739/m.158525 type:complete len:103 (+) Transcript_50739:899-1207(+)
MPKGVLESFNEWKMYVSKRVKIKQGIQFLTISRGARERPLGEAHAWGVVIPKIVKGWKFLIDKKHFLHKCLQSIKHRWTSLLLLDTFLLWHQPDEQRRDVPH